MHNVFLWLLNLLGVIILSAIVGALLFALVIGTLYVLFPSVRSHFKEQE